MASKPSHSRIRIALAQFCFAHSIELEELYAALGADMTSVDKEPLAHLAGLFDGMSVAAERIRQHGLDNWARDIS
ncbi:MAG: hypothetical protein ACWA5T_06480 [Parvularcula sp.]